jgi:hypothetical protein
VSRASEPSDTAVNTNLERFLRSVPTSESNRSCSRAAFSSIEDQRSCSRCTVKSLRER